MNKIKILVFIIIILTSCSTNLSTNPSETSIHDIQGCNHTSPYAGKNVSGIVGVITHKVSNGFTMQSLESDEKQCSSEGIFVFTKDYPTYMIGYLVSVNGLVAEFTAGEKDEYNLSQTEIIDPEIEVLQIDNLLPNPVLLDEMSTSIPNETIENDKFNEFDVKEDGLDFFESLEYMLVEIDKGVVVAPRNSYNEIIVLPEVFSQDNLLSTTGALLLTKTDQNPEKIVVKLPSEDEQTINVGDSLSSSIIGVMDYSYGNYKILSENTPEFTLLEKKIEPFQSQKGELTIASYNLENLSLFDNEEKYKEIAWQIIIDLSSPDILILHEVMDDSGTVDDGTVSANLTLERIVNEITNNGGPSYLYSDSLPINNQDGGIEGGNIRSVLLYRADRDLTLEPVSTEISNIKYRNGEFQIESNPLRIGEFSESFFNSRKPSIWLFDQNGKQFMVVGVHLISKGSDTPDWGSQQPSLKPNDSQRQKQALFISQYLEDILKNNNTIPIIIAGDMNDTPWSETLTTLLGNSFFNTAEHAEDNELFSYIFEGNAEQLDYILVNDSESEYIIQARFLHINSTKDHDQRISDHDPVIIEMYLNH